MARVELQLPGVPADDLGLLRTELVSSLGSQVPAYLFPPEYHSPSFSVYSTLARWRNRWPQVRNNYHLSFALSISHTCNDLYFRESLLRSIPRQLPEM